MGEEKVSGKEYDEENQQDRFSGKPGEREEDGNKATARSSPRVYASGRRCGIRPARQPLTTWIHWSWTGHLVQNAQIKTSQTTMNPAR